MQNEYIYIYIKEEQQPDPFILLDVVANVMVGPLCIMVGLEPPDLGRYHYLASSRLFLLWEVTFSPFCYVKHI